MPREKVKGHSKVPFIDDHISHGTITTFVYRGLLALGILLLAYGKFWGDNRYVNTDEHKGTEKLIEKHGEDISRVIQHTENVNLHMSYQEKVDTFLPRREFEDYKQQTNKQLSKIDGKLDRLILFQLQE